MENQRPLILISNDDGVIAKGISELIKFLRPLGEIVVMAPDAPRSGNASALTVTEPIQMFRFSGRLCEACLPYSARPQTGFGSRRYQSWR